MAVSYAEMIAYLSAFLGRGNSAAEYAAPVHLRRDDVEGL